MKKIFSVLLACLMISGTVGQAISAPTTLLGAAATQTKEIKYKPNAGTLVYAFVFDGPSEKNKEIVTQFQKAIKVSTAPDYKASFPANFIYTGDWSIDGVKKANDKAMASSATMIISLGYLSTKDFNQRQNKSKFVVTIDQYGLRDLGDGFFNPVQQNIKGVQMFKRLINFKKVAIFMNENYYKTKSDWNKFLAPKLQGFDFVVIPVNSNIDDAIAKVNDCDAAIITPLFNLTLDQRKSLFSKLNEKKLPTYSTNGKDDVVNGVLLGTGAYDLDRKVAESMSFSIHNVIHGTKNKPTPISFYEDEIIYINQDTADLINYQPHLRVINSAEIITSKKPTVYNLTTIFDTIYNQNLDIERKKLLLKAAKRSSLAAVLKWLPSFGMTVGYQSYNHDYADTVKLSMPEKTGVFSFGLEQIIYSPALVTNILVKRKMVDFHKAEDFMTEQNMGINTALLYVDTLMMENMIKIQKDYVKESRENLAIARVREKMGKCGREEALRWAAQLNINEQNLLEMKAESKNLKIGINKLLNKDQTEDYELAPLTASDPAFYTSEIHIIDYVGTPQMLENFTKYLVEESYRVAPELAKLKAAIKAKDYEMAMYYQKFILPDAKLNLDYTTYMGREFAGETVIPAQDMRFAPGTPVVLPKPGANNLRFGLFAQWKPIEGGTKIAEIARIKAEREELKRYEDEVKTELEKEIRTTINKAIAAYFSIEKDYKAMYAAGENYKEVKKKYLEGKVQISQIVDAQNVYLNAKMKAMNSQYEFFGQLLWVQRAICAVDWNKATPEAKAFIQKLKDNLEERKDIQLL